MQNPNTASQKSLENAQDVANRALTQKVKMLLIAAAALTLAALPHIASAGPIPCPSFGC